MDGRPLHRRDQLLRPLAVRTVGPPPPAPVSVSPATVNSGVASIDLHVTGAASGAASYFDNPAFYCRLAAGIPGVTVNSVTVTSPTTVTVNVSTVGASAGVKAITIANPDGQAASSGAIFTVIPGTLVTIDVPVWQRRTAADRAGLGHRRRRVDRQRHRCRARLRLSRGRLARVPRRGDLRPAPVGHRRRVWIPLHAVRLQRHRRLGPPGRGLHHRRLRPLDGHGCLQRQRRGRGDPEHLPPAPPIGVVDTPANGVTVAGEVPFTGWALDDSGIAAVNLYRSPVAGEGSALIDLGQATFIGGARPDVQAAYGTLPSSDLAGWGFMVLTNMLPNHRATAPSTSHAYAVDVSGLSTLLGSRRIVAANATSTKPFGTIDTPGQGETVSPVSS